MNTAITELIEKIESFGFILHDDTKKEFLEKEKEQIIDAAKHGSDFENSPYKNAEEYYEKTYNNNETKKSN